VVFVMYLFDNGSNRTSALQLNVCKDKHEVSDSYSGQRETSFRVSW
jgi:hypothetical protein